MFKIYKEELEVNGKKLTLETGKSSSTSRWRYYRLAWRNCCYSNKLEQN